MALEVKYKVKFDGKKWADVPVRTMEVSPFDSERDINFRFMDILQNNFKPGDEILWIVPGTHRRYRVRWTGSETHGIGAIL